MKVKEGKHEQGRELDSGDRNRGYGKGGEQGGNFWKWSSMKEKAWVILQK